MMITYIQALGIILAMGLIGWLVSLSRKDVSLVDSLWSLMFLAAAVFYSVQGFDNSLRSLLILVLIMVWALRLSIHLTVRNWDQPEDRRYQQIRRNNEPHFEWKSLYLVFGLQGFLAWVISVPLLIALVARTEFHWIDFFAVAFWLFGFLFESIADWQLYQFQKSPANQGRVLNSGLWRYSRHPNYFGEFCIWWGFFLFALAAGGWWTVYAPLLMSFLLLKVSGVILMEKDITSRRPEYQDYIEKTNAFYPARPHDSGTVFSKGSLS